MMINKFRKYAAVMALGCLCSSTFATIPANQTGYISGTDTIQIFGHLWVDGYVGTGGGAAWSNDGDQVALIRGPAAYHADLLSTHATSVHLRFIADSTASSPKYLGSVVASHDGRIGLLDDDGQWTIEADTDNYIKFAVNNSGKMYIRSNGKVGIWTSSPGYRLDVNGDGRFRNDLLVEVTDGQADLTVNSNSTTHDTTFSIKGNNHSWVMRNDISRGHALSIRSRSPSDSTEMERIIVQQNGETEFKEEVTIPAGGDIPMGNFTSN